MLLAHFYRPWPAHLVLALLAIASCLCTPAFAASGSDGKIVFTSDRTGSWQIYTMNPDGSDVFQVTNLPPTDDDEIFATLSPDGKQIAFNYQGGDGLDIYIVNTDGTGLRQITTDHVSLLPNWRPDGKRIAFTQASEFGTGVIAVMTPDGKVVNHLTSSDWDSGGPIYTHDGKHIVFGSEMGGYVSAVWIMNSDGSHQQRLTRAAMRGAPNSISPDNRTILLTDNRDSPPALPNSLYRMNIDGTGLKKLAGLRQFHHDLGPSYSPDGGRISFSSDRFSDDITTWTYGTFSIFVVNADGTDINEIFSSAGSCPFDGNCVGTSWGAGADQ